jgi:hypothetical protein
MNGDFVDEKSGRNILCLQMIVKRPLEECGWSSWNVSWNRVAVDGRTIAYSCVGKWILLSPRRSIPKTDGFFFLA